MRNNSSQQNSIFSRQVFTMLGSIMRSFSKDLHLRVLSSERVFEMRPVCFLYFAIFWSVLSSFFALKAESSVSSLAYQKDNFSVTPESNSHEVKSLEVKPPSFFEKRAEGWHWYESLSDNKIKEKKKTNNSIPPPQTPTEKIEAQRKALETKLHTAILEPSDENLIAYILAQKALMDQSQRFSEVWKKVVLNTPSLDETLIHPVDQNARHIYYDEERNKLSKKIQVLASEYGLFFFFRKNCSYCHHFAPIVKRFADKYNWSVLGISLDGGTLSEFPRAKRDNGISARLGISHVPALIALHPKTRKLIPLAYGFVSENEIEERIELLTRLQIGDLKK